MIIWSRTTSKVRIEVPNHSVTRCLCIERFRSPDDWVSTGAILRRCPGGVRHATKVSIDDRVLGDAAPDLTVVFEGILIRGC
jgi:hypothetical protein